MKHTFAVEAHYPDIITRNEGWAHLVTDSLAYCRGFLEARRDVSPRPPYRIRRDDGKIVEELRAVLDVRIGMIAGYPTGAQLLGAARRVLGEVRENEGYVSEAEAQTAARALRALGVTE